MIVRKIQDRRGNSARGSGTAVFAAAVALCAVWVFAGCGAQPQPEAIKQLGKRFAAGRATHPTAFAPPAPPETVGIDSPYAIAVSGDTAWFTEYSAAVIGRFKPGGSPKRIKLAKDGFPERLTIAHDGAVWFTDAQANRIGCITSGADKAKYYFVPTPESGPAGIAAAGDGAIWFTEHAANKIGVFVPPGSERAKRDGRKGFREFALPEGGGPAGIAIDSKGRVWFAENSGNRIGRITLAPGSDKPIINEYPLPARKRNPNGVAVGGDGNVYFTELAANRIGQVTPMGNVSEMVLPVNAPALDITAAPDGTIWMTVPKAKALCRLRPGYPISAFFLPQTTVPAFIAARADGAVYFTEPNGKIGLFTSAGLLTEFNATDRESAHR